MIGSIIFLYLYSVANLHGFRPVKRVINREIVSLRTMRLQMGYDEKENGSEKKTRSKFDRVIDDFVGKRFGAGEAFYGKRTSDMSDEQFSAIYELKDEVSSKWGTMDMRDNAILILGGTTDIAQWIAFELAEKGFDIRIAAPNIKDAVKIYGIPGTNCDIVELNKSTTRLKYERAINGVQAVVICSGFDFDSSKGGFLSDILSQSHSDDLLITNRVLEYISTLYINKNIKKVVTLSRYLPPAVFNDRLQSSKKLFGFIDIPTDIDVNLLSKDKFRVLHKDMEDRVRNLRKKGIIYNIIRAPPVVEAIAGGSIRPLLLLQDDNVNQGRSIGLLDMAEATVQTLIQDCSFVTYTLTEAPRRIVNENNDEIPLIRSNAMDNQYDESYVSVLSKRDDNALSDRVKRPTYYKILEMEDNDMKTSYMIRERETYLDQLKEDEAVEKFWADRLLQLKSDQF